LVDNDKLETTYEHKKMLNGKHEAPVNKLSTVKLNKQTRKGEQVLNEMTRKATDQ